MNIKYSQLHFLVILFFFLQSCVNHRDLIGLQVEEGEPFSYAGDISNSTQFITQPYDLLKIDVYSAIEDVVQEFRTNQSNQNAFGPNMGGGGATGNNLELFTGFFVDVNGEIDFPKLGKVRVAGLTTEAIQALLQREIRVYVKDAVVNVRVLNFKVTVVGEVNNPGIINLTNKRITVLEAIGYAGDFSPYANRKQVLLVREIEGIRQFVELDLRSRDIFQSPYFYLKQNDAIYVEPLKSKTASIADPLGRILSFGSAFVSLVTLIIAIAR